MSVTLMSSLSLCEKTQQEGDKIKSISDRCKKINANVKRMRKIKRN